MSFFVSRCTVIAGGLATVTALTLAVCPRSGRGEIKSIKVDGDIATIAVGTTPKPYIEILKWVQDSLIKGSGIKLDIEGVSDYQTPNSSLGDDLLAANFYQILSFLAQQNRGKGYDFVSIAGVRIEPMDIYTFKGYKDVKKIKEGGTIILSNDPANTAHGLKPLAQVGPIELGKSAGLSNNTDVTSNPKKLEFTTINGAQVYKPMPDTGVAVISGNCTIDVGLNPKKDTLVLEKGGKGSEYPNQLVVRKSDKDNEHLKKLAKLLNGEKLRDYTNKTWPDGAVVAVF